MRPAFSTRGWVLSALFFVALFWSSGGFHTGHLPMRPFSSAIWKREAESGERVSMVNALLLTYELNGASRREIVALLGPPTATDYFSEWDAVYWLGDERGLFRIDSEWLVFRYDREDRVAEYAVLSD